MLSVNSDFLLYSFSMLSFCFCRKWKISDIIYDDTEIATSILKFPVWLGGKINKVAIRNERKCIVKVIKKCWPKKRIERKLTWYIYITARTCSRRWSHNINARQTKLSAIWSSAEIKGLCLYCLGKMKKYMKAQKEKPEIIGIRMMGSLSKKRKAQISFSTPQNVPTSMIFVNFTWFSNFCFSLASISELGFISLLWLYYKLIKILHSNYTFQNLFSNLHFLSFINFSYIFSIHSILFTLSQLIFAIYLLVYLFFFRINESPVLSFFRIYPELL